jgi:hypothetical protein
MKVLDDLNQETEFEDPLFLFLPGNRGVTLLLLPMQSHSTAAIKSRRDCLGMEDNLPTWPTAKPISPLVLLAKYRSMPTTDGLLRGHLWVIKITSKSGCCGKIVCITFFHWSIENFVIQTFE